MDATGARALELDDRALALAAGGRVLAAAPSAVWDGSTVEPCGALAWNALRRRPRAVSTRHWSGLDDAGAAGQRSLGLALAELQLRVQAVGWGESRVWIAVPATASAAALGRLLGAESRCLLHIEGFIDASVARAAALGLDRPALAVELGLHASAVVALECTGQARRRHVLRTDGGLLALYEGWLALLRALSVRRSRFDPLHRGESEQRLFEALPRLAEEAQSSGQSNVRIERGNSPIELVVTRDQLAEAAQWLYREILQMLHHLRPAGAPVTLLVPQLLAKLPGMRKQLEEFRDCELVMLPDGFAAAAASALELPGRSSTSSVPLLRGLRVQHLPACEALASRTLLGRDGVAPRPPTHVLFEGRLQSLDGGPLTIGRGAVSERGLSLPDGTAGVSRRHCTLLSQGGVTVLVDHSRFGTFVNGERVRERVRVHAGDRIRIGDPGMQLELIAGEAHAASAR
jgi:hypothetical protein